MRDGAGRGCERADNVMPEVAEIAADACTVDEVRFSGGLGRTAPGM